jgi:hypothetical protein
MALTLTGVCLGMRPVFGVVEEGPRKGEKWEFLSMEITDTRFGKVYSCQLRHDDPQYEKLVAGGELKENLIDHKVRVTIKSMTAGEREIEDKSTGQTRTILQIRTQVTNVRDLGTMNENDE